MSLKVLQKSDVLSTVEHFSLLKYSYTKIDLRNRKPPCKFSLKTAAVIIMILCPVRDRRSGFLSTILHYIIILDLIRPLIVQ